MEKIIIDDEFKSLIPPLTDSEYDELESLIKDKRQVDPLKTWRGILIDGHHRYKICTANNIPFKTEPMQFDSREEAMEWMIHYQLARRNVLRYQRFELVMHLAGIYKAKGRENMALGGKTKLCQNSDNLIDTKKQMAKLAGMSHDTYYHAVKIYENGSEEEKEALRRGEATINKIFVKITSTEVRKYDRKADEEAIKESKDQTDAAEFDKSFVPPNRSGKRKYAEIDKWREICCKDVNLFYAVELLRQVPEKLEAIDFSALPEKKKKVIYNDALLPALTAVETCLLKASEACGIKQNELLPPAINDLFKTIGELGLKQNNVVNAREVGNWA